MAEELDRLADVTKSLREEEEKLIATRTTTEEKK